MNILLNVFDDYKINENINTNETWTNMQLNNLFLLPK